MSNARDNLIAKYCQRKREHDQLETKIRESSLSVMRPFQEKRHEKRRGETRRIPEGHPECG